MKFLLFGTGDYYERYKKWFAQDSVVALLDNSTKRQNTILDGHLVVAPEVGIRWYFDVVVILSFYVKEMKQQLMELGVPESKIYHFYDLHSLIYDKSIKRPIMYYGGAKELLHTRNKMSRILLLSQDLTLGGPAIALLHIAEVLKKNGYEVVYASMIDGPLRNSILEAGIPVIVDENLQLETMSNAEWTREFSLIICSTINYHVFLSDRDTNIPIIWWLHDSDFFYDGINKEVFNTLDLTSLKVVSVGSVPRKALHRFLPDLQIDDLLYGVSDTSAVKHIGGGKRNRVCFTTIGYIEKRKGQDILVAAIKMLPEILRKQAVFYFVGQNKSIMARNIQQSIADMPEIIMTGTVGRDEIDEILCGTDALICPSREDPMPTVAAEAMMHSIPCLLSDATGTSEYIKDEVEGLIFENEDAKGLCEKLEWCIENRDRLEQMGKNARKVYDNVFSMKVFENNLLNLLDIVINV